VQESVAPAMAAVGQGPPWPYVDERERHGRIALTTKGHAAMSEES